MQLPPSLAYYAGWAAAASHLQAATLAPPLPAIVTPLRRTPEQILARSAHPLSELSRHERECERKYFRRHRDQHPRREAATITPPTPPTLTPTPIVDVPMQLSTPLLPSPEPDIQPFDQEIGHLPPLIPVASSMTDIATVDLTRSVTPPPVAPPNHAASIAAHSTGAGKLRKSIQSTLYHTLFSYKKRQPPTVRSIKLPEAPTADSDDDEEARAEKEKRAWKSAVIAKTREMQDTKHFKSGKNETIKQNVQIWAAAAKTQGVCTGTEVGGRHHPACGGQYRFTPATVFAKTTEAAHWLRHKRNGVESEKIYHVMRHHSHENAKKYLPKVRFLHIDCHSLESKEQQSS
jgi:hypothetical protein